MGRRGCTLKRYRRVKSFYRDVRTAIVQVLPSSPQSKENLEGALHCQWDRIVWYGTTISKPLHRHFAMWAVVCVVRRNMWRAQGHHTQQSQILEVLCEFLKVDKLPPGDLEFLKAIEQLMWLADHPPSKMIGIGATLLVVELMGSANLAVSASVQHQSLQIFNKAFKLGLNLRQCSRIKSIKSEK